jgi:hypothetical protein
MATWDEFAAADPALAKAGEGQLFQYGVGLAFLATIRKDGGPRLHPVCPVLSNSHLYVMLLPNSPKRRDLQRDGRYAMQAFAQDRPDSDEFYIRGTARRIGDPELIRAVVSDAKHHANPDEVLFELEIELAMRTTWEGFGTPDYRPSHSIWVAAGWRGRSGPMGNR